MTDPKPETTILIAEDNPSVREFLVRALRSPAVKIVDVGDGQQALDVLSRQRFDILLTDIVMPTVDGIALALKAIRLYPDLRIIMISGYAQERMRAHNLDALAHKILAKPFSLEEVQEAVATLLKGTST